MSLDKFTENKNSMVNDNDPLFSKSNINTIVYSYLNSNNIKNQFMMFDDKTNRYIVSKLYSLFNKFFKLSGKNIDRHILREFEDKIYSVNGVVLPDYHRIQYEIHKNRNTNLPKKQYSEYIPYLIDKTKTLIMQNDLRTEKQLMDMKKLIVLLQIINGENVTFFEASYELFMEYCKNLNEIINRKDLIEFDDDNENCINNKLY